MKKAAAILSLLSLVALVAASVAASQPQAQPPHSARPQMTIPAIAKAANGAIVSIIMSDKDGQPVAQGTGFLISSDGRILTNYHVIENGASAIVKLPDGAFYVVDGVLASDKARDVALIKAHGANFHALALGNSDRVQVGEDVVAIGNPLSLESTVSNGIVSGIRIAEAQGGKFLQVTTPISHGSSGGPLFNMSAEVVGITSMGIEGGANLNFAIPINDAKRLLLAVSSTIQQLPNEPEPVKGQTRDEGTSPSASVPGPRASSGARDYYQQLHDAGGFHGDIPSYVCFSDDAHSDTFFTFRADASLTRTNYERGVKVETRQYNRTGTGSQWLFVIPPEYNTVTPPWKLVGVPYTATSKFFYLSIELTTMRYLESEKAMTTTGKGGWTEPEPTTITQNYGPWSGICERVLDPK